MPAKAVSEKGHPADVAASIIAAASVETSTLIQMAAVHGRR